MFGYISKKKVKNIINEKILELHNETQTREIPTPWITAQALQDLKRKLKL